MLLIVFIASYVVVFRHKQREVRFVLDLVQPFIKYLYDMVVAISPVFQAPFTGADDPFITDLSCVV